MGHWRKGSRAPLKTEFRKECRFESYMAYCFSNLRLTEVSLTPNFLASAPIDLLNAS